MKGTLGRLVGVFEVSCLLCLLFFWSSNVYVLCSMFLRLKSESVYNHLPFRPTEPGEETQNLRVRPYCNRGAGGLGGLSQHW